MKKLLMVVFLLVMAGLAALPAAAQQQYQGYRMGPEMMDQRYNVQQRTSVDEDKLKAYNEEMEKHYKNTASQRQEILVMQHEIATLLINTKTTKDVVLDKQKELQVLVNNLQQQELSFRWDIYKKYPELAPDIYGGCLGPAAGYGESGMMGYGAYGHGMMYTDDYEEHGPGMMGSGWMNWRKWWPWRDKN